MKKFKHWLIRKLGGYVKEAPPMISERTIKPVEVCVSTCISLEHLQTFPEPIMEKEINQRCAESLARELINEGLCETMRTYEERFGYAVFKTGITVIPQERSEGI